MDNYLHLIGCGIIVVAAVLRMNAMQFHSTPKLELIAWWSTGVGAFSQFVWTDPTPGWADASLVMGIALLAILVTQPQWRHILAERRRIKMRAPPFELREGPVDEMHDRRLQGDR